jgi:hypothetical protein
MIPSYVEVVAAVWEAPGGALMAIQKGQVESQVGVEPFFCSLRIHRGAKGLRPREEHSPHHVDAHSKAPAPACFRWAVSRQASWRPTKAK